MITAVVMKINHDLCELYVVEENCKAFAFIPNCMKPIVLLGGRYLVTKEHQDFSFCVTRR